MSTEQPKPELYDDAIVIDGLNVSNWASTNDYDSLYNGGVTAINATVAIWDGFRETLDNITDWVYRFDEQSDRLLRIGTVQDIRRAKVEGRTGASYSVGRTPRLSKTSSTVWRCFTSSASASSSSPITNATCSATAAGNGATRV